VASYSWLGDQDGSCVLISRGASRHGGQRGGRENGSRPRL